MRGKPALWLWLAGMPGVLSLALLVVPPLSLSQAPDVAPWVAGLASAVQGGLLLALAVWAGSRLAPAVGLGAPLFAALAGSGRMSAAIRGRVLPGLVGGAAGGLVLIVSGMHAPDALVHAQETVSVPLSVRVLYGGITEELLMRWGVMTGLVWLFWRFAQRGQGAPTAAVVWAGIAASAILFGLGHLPIAHAGVGTEPLGVAGYYVVATNTVFGLVAGVLFWRWGLEAAMLAHVTAHLAAAAVMAIAG